MTPTRSTPTRDSFTRWVIEQVAGGLTDHFDPRFATLAETIEEYCEINEDQGFTLDKSVPGSLNFVRHEGVSLDSDDFAIAVALALLWWTDRSGQYAARIADAGRIIARDPDAYNGTPALLVGIIAPRYWEG